jgi:tetratricopeptide (TPR) repeat protein
LKKSIEYYEQATKSDPVYALAYVGISDSYGMTTVTAGAFPPAEAASKAKEAALKALAIDDALAEAHVSLGRVKMNFDWDWAGAEREFRRAIDLNPAYAEAHHLYAHYLTAMKRFPEAFEASRRYLELDPLNLPANNHLSWHYFYARQYDEALAQLRRTAEMEPNFVGMLLYLGWVYEQTKMYSEAIATFKKAVQLSATPLMLGSLGHAYALSGKRADAQNILARLDDLSKERYVSPYDRAIVYVGLNDWDQAFDWLQRASQERAQFMIYLDTDPRFDAIRSDARFGELLRRMRFPALAEAPKTPSKNH